MPRHSRSPRVSVPNQERVIITIGSSRTVGTLCRLSATGGAIRLAKPYSRGTYADLTVNTTRGKVTAALEFLSTRVVGHPDAQSFRFVHMEPADRRRLEHVLKQMRAQGFGEKLTMAERAMYVATRTGDRLGALLRSGS
jgi:hypothetical protein